MNRVIGLLFFLTCIAACNNNDSKDHSGGKETPKSKADSLMEDVMDGHDAGMAKYGKLRSAKQQVQNALDSIAKLPAKAREQLGALKTNLETAGNELNEALAGMDKWMEEFNMDSAVNNMEQRINYLMNEKLKIGKVKESMLKSLQDADSILKAKLP